MRAAEIITALDLPYSALVEQRVPKKLLVENGAPTAADKRRINEGIEEIHWLAALKPNTIGVPAFRDELREYLEIAVLNVTLRPAAKTGRLGELVHRAVPYPVVLLLETEDGLELSLAHKRWSQGEAGRTVLEGGPVAVSLSQMADSGFVHLFLEALPLARQPRGTLYALYQGWIDIVLTLQAARLSGTFTLAASPEHAEDRRSALQECSEIEVKIAALRSAAAKEKQLHRQVELNLELKRLQSVKAALRAKL